MSAGALCRACEGKHRMTLHLVKLCVGAEGIEDLADWQRRRLSELRKGAANACLSHTTRMVPKRQDQLLDGGSLYWVIKGMIQVRQKIAAFGEGRKHDGTPCCLIYLDPKLVVVRPTPRRAFQGWRYLAPADAPPDLEVGAAQRLTNLPLKMRQELAELGLL
jgi:hypothetical protein